MKYLLAGAALAAAAYWWYQWEDPYLRNVERLLAVRKTYGYRWEDGVGYQPT